MSECKFKPGDKVTVAPRIRMLRGSIFTVKCCNVLVDSHGRKTEYYSLNETRWTFYEYDLIPYTDNENLISSLDLSSLFKEGL